MARHANTPPAPTMHWYPVSDWNNNEPGQCACSAAGAPNCSWWDGRRQRAADKAHGERKKKIQIVNRIRIENEAVAVSAVSSGSRRCREMTSICGGANGVFVLLRRHIGSYVNKNINNRHSGSSSKERPTDLNHSLLACCGSGLESQPLYDIGGEK